MKKIPSRWLGRIIAIALIIVAIIVYINYENITYLFSDERKVDKFLASYQINLTTYIKNVTVSALPYWNFNTEYPYIINDIVTASEKIGLDVPRDIPNTENIEDGYKIFSTSINDFKGYIMKMDASWSGNYSVYTVYKKGNMEKPIYAYIMCPSPYRTIIIPLSWSVEQMKEFDQLPVLDKSKVNTLT